MRVSLPFVLSCVGLMFGCADGAGSTKSSTSHNYYKDCISEVGVDSETQEVWESTIKTCTAALAQHLPQDARSNALVMRAIAYERIDPNQSDLALKDAEEAIQLDPEHSYAYRIRAIAEWDLGRKDDAIRDFDEAVRLEPREAYHYLIRGTYLSLSDRQSDAELDFDKALSLDPSLSFEVAKVRWANEYYGTGVFTLMDPSPDYNKMSLCQDADGAYQWFPGEAACPAGYKAVSKI